MATIAENLLVLKQVQLELRAAIESKGVPVGAAPFVDYPALVMAISTSGGGVSPVGQWMGEEATWNGEPVTWGTS
jgi:hypothetical protein